MPRDPFAENVVIVTGASQGVGEQLAQQLAARGAWLALAARHADALEAVAARCRLRGGRAIAIPTDVTDPVECQRLIERALAEYGRIDTLINNAGMGYPKRFDVMRDFQTMRQEIELNYLGTAYCTFYALPYLKQAKGRLVGVNSFGGQVGISGTIGYNASKHAMRGFLNTLRAELHGTGVSVSVAYLGAIRTERLKEVMGGNIDKVPTMAPERCAALIIRQAARRQRQLVLTPSGKFLLWLNSWSPALVDRILVSIRSISYES